MGGPALPGEGGAPHSAVESKGRARTPRRAARGRWDSRRISAADLSAGFKEAVDARGCGARCTRRARERCAAPESVTGALKNLRGTKRQSDESWDLETDRGSRLITVFQTVEMSGLVYGTLSPKKRLKLCLCAQSYVLRGQAARSSSAVNTTRTRAEKERHTPARHVLPFRSHRARGADRRATRARPRSRAGLGPQRRLRGYGRRVRRAPRPRGRRARGRGGARPALRRLPLAARGHVRLLRSRVHQARAPGVPAGVRRVPLAEPGGVPQPGGGVLHRR